jgi:hypothetical protein
MAAVAITTAVIMEVGTRVVAAVEDTTEAAPEEDTIVVKIHPIVPSST